MAKAKSTEEKLKELDAKIKKLQEDKAKLVGKKGELTSESKGMVAALTAVSTAAEENKAAVADVLIAIARIKRTGLKIERGTRKKRVNPESATTNESEATVAKASKATKGSKTK